MEPGALSDRPQRAAESEGHVHYNIIRDGRVLQEKDPERERKGSDREPRRGREGRTPSTLDSAQSTTRAAHRQSHASGPAQPTTAPTQLRPARSQRPARLDLVFVVRLDLARPTLPGRRPRPARARLELRCDAHAKDRRRRRRRIGEAGRARTGREPWARSGARRGRGRAGDDVGWARSAYGGRRGGRGGGGRR